MCILGFLILCICCHIWVKKMLLLTCKACLVGINEHKGHCQSTHLIAKSAHTPSFEHLFLKLWVITWPYSSLHSSGTAFHYIAEICSHPDTKEYMSGQNRCLAIRPCSKLVFQLKETFLMSHFFQKVMKGVGDTVQLLHIKL